MLRHSPPRPLSRRHLHPARLTRQQHQSQRKRRRGLRWCTAQGRSTTGTRKPVRTVQPCMKELLHACKSCATMLAKCTCPHACMLPQARRHSWASPNLTEREALLGGKAEAASSRAVGPKMMPDQHILLKATCQTRPASMQAWASSWVPCWAGPRNSFEGAVLKSACEQ